MFLIVLSPLAFAPDGDEPVDVPVDTPVDIPPVDDYSDIPDEYYDTSLYETYSESENPGQWLVENYESADSQDYQDSLADFFSDPANIGTSPGADAIFFGDINNYVGNEEVFDAFFSGAFSDDEGIVKLIFGNEYSEDVPEGISMQTAAAEYLTEKFGASYTISDVGDDFSLNLGSTEPYEPATMVNNGQEIYFDDYKNSENIKEIVAWEGGIKIIEEGVDGVEREITFGGEKVISYDSFSGTIVLGDTIEEYQHSFVINRESGEDINFEFDDDKVIITGPVTGTVGDVRFDNHQGQLVINSNGDISAVNAEVITPTLYVDGNFQKVTNEEGEVIITAWNHGAGSVCIANCDDDDIDNDINKNKFGNVHTYETVIVDRTTSIGVLTLGQSGESNVEIHLDETYGGSLHEETPVREETSAAELQEFAKQVPKPQGDLGGSALVYIKDDTVFAKGKVAIYTDTYVDSQGPATFNLQEPHAIGINGISEFDAKLGGEKVDIRLGGPIQYSDREGFIETMQDGSAVRLQRPLGQQKDAIIVDCYSCEVGAEVVGISKPILLTEQIDSTYGVYGELDSTSLDISVVVTEEGMSFSHSLEGQGRLAALQSEDRSLVMGNDIVIQTSRGENENYNFQFAKDDQGDAIGLTQLYDVTDPENPELVGETVTDLGIKNVVGSKEIVVSDREFDDVQQVLAYLENGDYDGLALSGIDIDNPSVRELILTETSFDVSLIDDGIYMGTIGRAVEQQEDLLNYLAQSDTQQILGRHGIEFDSQGRCISGEACSAINGVSGDQQLTLVAYQIEILAKESQNSMIDSLVQSDVITSTDANIIIEENEKRISDLNGAGDWIRAEDKARKDAQSIQAGTEPSGATEDVVEVQNLGQNRKRLIGERIRLDYELQILQTQLVANPSGVAQILENDKNRNDILQIQDSLENIESSIAFIDDSVSTIAIQYADDRPDFAANLCSRAGSGCTAEFISQLGVEDQDSPLAQEAALNMVRYSISKNEDLAGASLFAEQITDEDLKVEADEMRWAFVDAQLEAFERESEHLVTEKRNEILEEYSGAIGFIDYVVDAVAQPISLIGAIIPGMPTYAELYEQADQISLERLKEERNGAILISAAMSSYERQGYTPEEAFQLLSQDGITKYGDLATQQDFLAAHDTSQLANLAKQSSGDYLNAEDIAGEQYDDIQRQFTYHEDRVYPIKDQIEAYVENNPGVETGMQFANTQLEYIDDNPAEAWVVESDASRMLQRSFTVFDIPLGGFAIKGAAAGVRALPGVVKAENAAIKGIKAFGSGARVTSLADNFAPVSRVLTKDRYVFDTTGKSLTRELDLAQAAGKLDDVKRIENALNGYKKAKALDKGLFTRDIFMNSEQAAKLEELKVARQLFESDVYVRGASSADSTHLITVANEFEDLTGATALVAANEKLEDSTEAVMADDLVTEARLQQEGVTSTGVLPEVQSGVATKKALSGPEPRLSKQSAGSKLSESTPSVEAAETYFKGSDVGLPNQQVFADNSVSGLSAGKVEQMGSVDIQLFKNINTKYGHDGGDLVLKEFSAELSERLGKRGVKVYHKGGKTFKLLCSGGCDNDLAVILAQEMDAIRESTVARVLDSSGGKIKLNVDEFNLYAGVSESKQMSVTSSLDDVVEEANRLNQQSLKAGKYGQLQSGKTTDASQVVKWGDVDDAMTSQGVKKSPDDLEDLLMSSPSDLHQQYESSVVMRELDSGEMILDDAAEELISKEIANEYFFFGEEIQYSGVEDLMNQRNAILQKASPSPEDLAIVREIDTQLLSKRVMDPNNKIIYGNENMKAVVNNLIVSKESVDRRFAGVVGGDELAIVIKRPDDSTSLTRGGSSSSASSSTPSTGLADDEVSKTSFYRLDINFFGRTNLEHGVPAADKMKDDALKIMQDVLEDARIGKIDDTDEVIAQEIVRRFDQKMIDDGITINAEIEGMTQTATGTVRPSLSIGFADTTGEVGEELVRRTASGETNGASVLNMVADEVAENQKLLGKDELIRAEGQVKELVPENFVTRGQVIPEDFDQIGRLETSEMDGLVAQHVLNDGDLANDAAYQAAKRGENLEDVVDEAVSGVSQSNGHPVFRKKWGSAFQGKQEEIVADIAYPALETKVQSTYQKTLGKLSADSSASDLERAADEFNTAMNKELPFLGHKNFDEFSRSDPEEALGMWRNYVDSFENGPRRLSDLGGDNMLNCNGQHLTVQQSIPDEGWKMYQDVFERADGQRIVRTHSFLAKRYGDNVVMIDTTELGYLESNAIDRGTLMSWEDFSGIYPEAELGVVTAVN